MQKTEVKEEDAEAADKDYKPHKIPSRMAGKIPDSEKNGRRSRRHPDTGDAKVDAQVGFGSEDEVSERSYLCTKHDAVVSFFMLYGRGEVNGIWHVQLTRILRDRSIKNENESVFY